MCACCCQYICVMRVCVEKDENSHNWNHRNENRRAATMLIHIVKEHNKLNFIQYIHNTHIHNTLKAIKWWTKWIGPLLAFTLTFFGVMGDCSRLQIHYIVRSQTEQRHSTKRLNVASVCSTTVTTMSDREWERRTIDWRSDWLFVSFANNGFVNVNDHHLYLFVLVVGPAILSATQHTDKTIRFVWLGILFDLRFCVPFPSICVSVCVCKWSLREDA